MIRHIGHLSPGRYYGHHHDSTVAIGICPVCHATVIRWSLMEADDRAAHLSEIKRRLKR